MPSVILQHESIKSLKGGHPWIFRQALAEIAAQSGDVVDILDTSKRFLGRGFYSAQSKIAVRLITRRDEVVDAAFWKKRLQRALAYRRQVVAGSSATRLVFSEADGFPGLIIDRYGDHLVMQTLCAGVERLKNDLIAWLRELCQPQAIIERNDQKVRELEGLTQQKGVLWGEPSAEVTINEGNIKFYVDLLGGQKTGGFIDQRDNHLRAGVFSRGRVLDGFCYQGGFALHLAAGAEQVLAVDSSQAALDVAAKNAALNKLSNITFEKAKMLDFLRDLKSRSELFDVISLDPPAFAKSRRDLESGERGYREINLRAMEILNEGGILITSSCSQHLSEDHFLKILAQAAAQARRQAKVIERRTQAVCHPMALGLPESRYLKCIILQMD